MCSETSKNNVDYKNTLSLPETDFPMRAGLPTREPVWLEHWEKLDVYNTLRKRTGRKQFILHDGPPYANGNLHIGHALIRLLKDWLVGPNKWLVKIPPTSQVWNVPDQNLFMVQ